MARKNLCIVLLGIVFFLISLNVGHAEPMLTWDKSSGEVAGYKIYYGTSSGSYPMSKDAGNVTQYALSSLPLAEKTTYFFIVRVYNSSGESDDSNEVIFNAPEFVVVGASLTTFEDSEKYEHPVYFGTTDKDITISWDSLSGATYEYRLWDINRETYALTGTSEEASATFKLPKTGCYEFEVRAKRDSDYTEWVKIDSRIVGWIAGVGPIVIGGN